MIIDGVVADANVLLSAVVGKAALRVFTEFSVPIHTSQFNADEVLEYLPVMAHKYDLPIDLVSVDGSCSQCKCINNTSIFSTWMQRGRSCRNAIPTTPIPSPSPWNWICRYGPMTGTCQSTELNV